MKDDSHAPSVSEAALTYALLGWPVFPVPPGTKRSYKNAKRSEGRKWGATTDPDEIAADWTRWPDANVGIVCGPKSGLLVIEADTADGHGVDGIGNLAELIKQNGELPDTIEAESPSGSRHHYFRYPAGEKIKNSTSVVAPGVDVRGDGGMVVGVPSVKGDVSYRWLNPPSFFELADCPEWLLALCRKQEPFKIDTGPSDYDADGGDERTIAEVEEALSYIDPDAGSYQAWVDILMALHADFGDAGLEIAERWSVKGAKYKSGEVEAKWGGFTAGGGIGIKTVFERARQNGCDLGELRRRHRGGGAHTSSSGGAKSEANDAQPQSEAPDAGEGVGLEDFVAHMPSHSYFFLPTREPWPAVSVNARIAPVPVADKPVSASAWLDNNRPVEQMTWAPGEPVLIEGRLMADGGWIARPGCSVLNLYRPPVIVPRAGDVTPWLNHLHYIYPVEAEHITLWLAWRVQKPSVKINHAVVFGGVPGIGKDTALEPVKQCVGPWNFTEVSPQQVLGRFNGFLRSVILRVSEARDLGEVDRFAFYDHMKVFTAAPPDVLRVDEKNLREYSIPNVCGVIHTTNHKADGLYLPADDRRHFVAWSERKAADFEPGYWNRLYRWFENGGNEAVAAYLHELDISEFDPKAPPPKTEAFWEIVNSNTVPETSEMADALERIGWPAATTISSIKMLVDGTSFGEWLSDRRNARKVPFRLEETGYVPVRNPDADDGRWRIGPSKQAVYARRSLPPSERLAAAAALSTRARWA